MDNQARAMASQDIHSTNNRTALPPPTAATMALRKLVDSSMDSKGANMALTMRAILKARLDTST